MEWIYTRTKVSGQNSLELALENRKKELAIFFTYLVPAFLNVPMDVWGLVR